MNERTGNTYLRSGMRVASCSLLCSLQFRAEGTHHTFRSVNNEYRNKQRHSKPVYGGCPRSRYLNVSFITENVTNVVHGIMYVAM